MSRLDPEIFPHASWGSPLAKVFASFVPERRYQQNKIPLSAKSGGHVWVTEIFSEELGKLGDKFPAPD